MRAHHIALKDLRIRLRDRNTLVLMLLLPIALTAIIGFAFGGGSGPSTIELLVVEPQNPDFLARAAADALYGMEGFEATPATLDEARAAVSAGRKPGAIVIPDSLSSAVARGASVELLVLKDPASSVYADVVEKIAERTAARLNAGGALSRAVFHSLGEERPMSGLERMRLTALLFDRAGGALDSGRFRVVEKKRERTEFNVRAYFAPSFAVLFLLFTMLASAKTIHEERESGTYQRLMTAPVSRATFIGGKFLGTCSLASVQVLLLIVLSSLLFGVRWGSHPLPVLAMALATAAGASSLAVLIAALTKTSRQTDNLGTAFVLVMSLVGGSMWPIEQAPESFRGVARFTFNYWAQSGFKELVFNDSGFAGIAEELLIILALSAVSFTLAARFLVRR